MYIPTYYKQGLINGFIGQNQWHIQSGGTRDRRPPLRPISFIFMQFSAKNLPNDRFSPQTQWLAPSGKSWNPTLVKPLLFHVWDEYKSFTHNKLQKIKGALFHA